MAILCVSREYRSGGEEIGHLVAEALRYDYVDKDRLVHDIKQLGEQWETLIKEADEFRPSLWERFDRQYQGFVALVEAHLLEYALRDRVVILGRGSNFLLQEVPFALKVRFTAPLETRVERVMAKDGLDQKTARWMIDKVDRSRAGYIQVNYGRDWARDEFYDLIFNTGIQTFDQVARILVEALKETDLRASTEARERLRQLVLAARVKARLLTDPKIFVPTLEVSHDGRAIVLQGVIHSPQEFQYLEERARQFAQDEPIRNELHYRE